MKANEEWRNDPVRRQAARDLCEKLADAYAFQLKTFRKAQESYENTARLEYQRTSQWRNPMSLRQEIEDAERKLKHYSNPTSCLIGNMAAFGEGYES